MKIILVGLPGKIASAIAEGVSPEALHSYAITSERHVGRTWTGKNGAEIQLVRVEDTKQFASTLDSNSKYVAMDFSPQASAHLPLWVELGVPVVIGSSLIKAEQIRAEVSSTSTLVVFGTNLAIPIVALQAILKLAAAEFPGVFKGGSLSVIESHQKEKKDVSGTARALLPSLNSLGFSGANIENIKSIRDPDSQRLLGVPEEYLSGHGWHRYEASFDGMRLALEHNTNGRAMYVAGALEACNFALQRWAAGDRGKCFDMVDVLRSK